MSTPTAALDAAAFDAAARDLAHPDPARPDAAHPDLAHPELTHPDPAHLEPDDRHVHDVVVVGGGAAGLSAAVTLARSLRDVVVVDAGEPRNAPAAGAHNLLGREGVPPGSCSRWGAGRRSRTAHTSAAGASPRRAAAPTASPSRWPTAAP
ncbi:FAD-dependent oxidoreductase [Cellulomonas sp. ATA003]|uniref:FAD-dependent oxidoreductase n=1 Tax=Cellulomonas sp. ATA003 TaxID=3073064 RepID=UPI0028737AC8|nr:FAD-dependent oxidoreductase [Cellulomonas sp. ATA003]WNB85635.1 FAD-dependent oxidoreductase [Cellulomonas sp. ATA003]